MWEWLANNKDWVFSGVGVAAGAVIVSIVFRRRRSPTGSNIEQTATTGSQSTITQIGSVDADVDVRHEGR